MNGLLFFLFVLSALVLVLAVEVQQGTTRVDLPRFIVFIGLLGSIISFLTGGLFGMVFAILDSAILGIVSLAFPG